MAVITFFGQAGCLLPLLILFNLFFGWMFLPVLYWLAAGSVLILLFFVNSYIFLRRLSKMTKPAEGARDGAIDVEGKVIEREG